METVRRILLDLLSLILPPRPSEKILASHSDALFRSKFSLTRLPDGVYVLSSYKDPLVGALISELKYRDNPRAAKMLGEALREALIALTEDSELTQVLLVPIPLFASRQKERGFNQMERILRHVLPLPNHTLSSALVKVRETLPQTKLSREARLQNLRGAFSVREPLSGEFTYVIVDDVTTTGATLAEATRALREAGARDIISIALAH